jgi:syntaxin-binding protein 1
MADITEEGVSLVEDIYRRRQPLPTMDAIYFMQPTKENVVMFLSDMTGRAPLYKKAFVFFSSPVPRELVSHIKKDGSVLARIGALREMNLEYFAIDSQGFITDNERALEDLFGDEESTRKGDACLNEMATRISTVFASLREFPFVRYRAAKSLDMNTMTTFRDLIPTKLAAGVWNCLAKYKANLPNFPQTETCELLIVDRSIDQIAPVIHEWTYDAMCHDLLNMEGNKYVHEVPGKVAGVLEKKEVLLEDHDPIWLELRHAHIADASERLHEKMTSFVSKNKAAQVHHGSRDGGELSTRDLQKMVQALPQYSEQIDKLSLHVDIAGKINRIIKDTGLKELGQLEQDLVFGDAGTKDVINFLRTKLDATNENKLRLLMIYAACYPEKFESDKITKLMELARLPPEDMNAVNNMRLLEGSSDTKKSSIGAQLLKFDVHKKHAARKDRKGEEVMWQLSRFYPMIEELVEKLSKGELPKNDYPCMNDPSPTFHGNSRAASNQTNPISAPHSMRQRRATWARPRGSDDGYSSDSILRHASSDFKKLGQRIFVFIVGGATRSELRVCHKLTAKLKREIVLGSSSLDDPPQFITKLKLMTADDELSLDDLQI